MKKAEKFALFAGVIGLIMDTIGLSTFLFQRASISSPGTELSLLLRILAVFSIIYGWFIISWILIRRSWTKSYPPIQNDISGADPFLRKPAILSRKLPEYAAFEKRLNNTVGSIGILLFPLQMLFFSTVISVQDVYLRNADQLMNQVRRVSFIFLLSLMTFAGFGVLIWGAIGLLMPIIYDDMKREI
jgi:hypothetical protein